MNIGIVVSNICNGAGTERAVANLANGMVEFSDSNVIIFSEYSNMNDTPVFKLNSKIKVIHLCRKTENNVIKRIRTYKRLYRDLKQNCDEYDISVLIGTRHAYNCVISAIRNVVRIGCEHTNYAACPKIFRVIRRIAYRRLDRVVLLTEEDMKNYAFLQKECVTVIPNIRSFYPEFPAKLENKKIITAGRLEFEKGYDILIDFADKLKEAIPGWEINIFGDGEMKEDLLSSIKEKKLEGFINVRNPVNDISKEMLDSSIFLMTSRHEGLPMVMIEAQACGLPIVSFDCPEGPKDIIHDGEDGYLVQCGNVELMTEKISEIADSIQLRKKMGEAARYHSGRYSIERIIFLWTKMLEDVTKVRAV